MKHQGRSQLSTSRNWAKRGSATLAAGAASTLGANAAVVQITLTDNYLTESLDNLNADISGDGISDLDLSGVMNQMSAVGFLSPNSSFIIAATVNLGGFYGGAGAYFWDTGQQQLIAAVGVPGIADFPYGYAFQSSMVEVSARALYPITFTDPLYGGDIEAWLEIETAATPDPIVDQTATARASLLRVIWDDRNRALRPTGIGVMPVTFPEAQPVPEPSGLALLALGVGGLLARRSRRARN